VRRSHMAQKMLMYLSVDIKIKERFYNQILNTSHSLYGKLKPLVQLLQNRLVNSQLSVQKSGNLIKLGSQTYDHIVDNGLNEHSNRLNRILKALAALTVSFIPFQVLSAFFGLNVQVPMQHINSIFPFFILMILCATISTSLLLTFRYYLNWI
jgi:Mg2+ and Co2+ transporter CorA